MQYKILKLAMLTMFSINSTSCNKSSDSAKKQEPKTNPAPTGDGTEQPKNDQILGLTSNLESYISQTQGATTSEFYTIGFSSSKVKAESTWKSVGYDKDKYSTDIKKVCEQLLASNENADYKLGFFKGMLEYTKNLPAKPSTTGTGTASTPAAPNVADIDTHSELKSLLLSYLDSLKSQFVDNQEYKTALSVGKSTAATVWSNLSNNEAEYAKLLAKKSSELNADQSKTVHFKLGTFQGYFDYTQTTILGGVTTTEPQPIAGGGITTPTQQQITISSWSALRDLLDDYEADLGNQGAVTGTTFYTMGFNSGKSNAETSINQAGASAIQILADSGKRIFDASSTNKDYRLGYLKGISAAIANK